MRKRGKGDEIKGKKKRSILITKLLDFCLHEILSLNCKHKDHIQYYNINIYET